jgi:hypothetical protein
MIHARQFRHGIEIMCNGVLPTEFNALTHHALPRFPIPAHHSSHFLSKAFQS